MTEFERLYQQNKGTVEDCLKAIHSHSRVCFAGDGNQANTIMENLHKIAPNVVDVKCIKGRAGDYLCVTDPSMNGHISFTSFLYGREMMTGQTQRNVSFVPADICDFGTFMADYRPRDTFVAAVSPMDERGYFQLGLSNMWEEATFNTCDTIILEVNPQLPRVKGGLRIHVRDVTVLTEVDYAPLQVPDMETTEVEERIGANVAELVHDGDCIQLGIGSMPNAVGHHLMDRKDLGLHTEMFTSIMGEMIRKGVITGARKNYNKGVPLPAAIWPSTRLWPMTPTSASSPPTRRWIPARSARMTTWCPSTPSLKWTSPARSALNPSAPDSSPVPAVPSALPTALCIPREDGAYWPSRPLPPRGSPRSPPSSNPAPSYPSQETMWTMW